MRKTKTGYCDNFGNTIYKQDTVSFTVNATGSRLRSAVLENDSFPSGYYVSMLGRKRLDLGTILIENNDTHKFAERTFYYDSGGGNIDTENTLVFYIDGKRYNSVVECDDSKPSYYRLACGDMEWDLVEILETQKTMCMGMTHGSTIRACETF